MLAGRLGRGFRSGVGLRGKAGVARLSAVPPDAVGVTGEAGRARLRPVTVSAWARAPSAALACSLASVAADFLPREVVDGRADGEPPEVCVAPPPSPVKTNSMVALLAIYAVVKNTGLLEPFKYG